MYKTIFTYLPSPQTVDYLSELSAFLADTHRAHLIGAHNSARISLYGGVPSDILAQHNHSQRETAKTIEQSFEKAATARNLSHEWRHKALNDTEVLGDIIHQARIADLVVACVNDKSDPLSSFHDVPIRLVLETGRPVLLVPANTQMKSVGQRITIAWNHSRESARAVFDALPLLRMAVSVEILAVNPKQDGATSPGEDLASALSRHGVKARAVVVNAAARSEGDELTAALAKHESDMLVMGCYGHSRLREMVLGGVTKYVLGRMTMPVLLSH
jgi:nucleotide-binding universal stress UspA family protein